MPRQLICDSCGKPIESIGWKALPCIVVNDSLVGVVPTDDKALQHALVGDPQELCERCVPLAHPKENNAD